MSNYEKKHNIIIEENQIMGLRCILWPFNLTISNYWFNHKMNMFPTETPDLSHSALVVTMVTTMMLRACTWVLDVPALLFFLLFSLKWIKAKWKARWHMHPFSFRPCFSVMAPSFSLELRLSPFPALSYTTLCVVSKSFTHQTHSVCLYLTNYCVILIEIDIEHKIGYFLINLLCLVSIRV